VLTIKISPREYGQSDPADPAVQAEDQVTWFVDLEQAKENVQFFPRQHDGCGGNQSVL